MIASLPMYDLPAQQPANDRYWKLIRDNLGYGPDHLTRGGDLWDQWRAPDLLLSQTCGYPYRACLHGKVQLVATPDYGLEGCPAGYYNSVFVVRADDPSDALSDFASARFAYNEPLSQSGWAAPQHHVRSLGFHFDDVMQTGGHRASALAVAKGTADITALDALTWQLLKKSEDFPSTLREMARTEPTPVLPYITALDGDADALFGAIASAIAALSDADREALSLRGVVKIAAEDYLVIPTPPGPEDT